MQIPFVDLKAQYHTIKTEIDQAIRDVIERTAFIGDKVVEDFEKEFATLCHVDYCVGVGNGTDALWLALKAAGIGPGDEVITAANSFIATSEAITAVGARVKFVDIDPETYTLSAEAVGKAIGDKTRAIIPVHLYGHPAEMDEILNLAEKHKLVVIEDAAQAHGAEYKGRRTGSMGDLGCFSFYPGKNLGAYGDAGAVVTNNEIYARKIKILANHGRKDKYDHQLEGVNSRLDSLQAAVLRVKVRYLQQWNESRREKALLYDSLLSGVGEIQVTRAREYVKPVFHLYVVRARKRDDLRAHLESHGISTGIHYPIPLPELEAYRYLGHKPEDFPVASTYARHILSLPIFPELTFAQMSYAVDQIKAFYAKSRAAVYF